MSKNIKEILKKILKEEDESYREFNKTYTEEFNLFKKRKNDIINYIKSEYENLFDVDVREKSVLLGSFRVKGEYITIRRFVITFKFIIDDKMSYSDKRNIMSDIESVINYYGIDTKKYGAAVELKFKKQTWVDFLA